MISSPYIAPFPANRLIAILIYYVSPVISINNYAHLYLFQQPGEKYLTGNKKYGAVGQEVTTSFYDG
jgi:hypothetical protein